MSRSHHCLVFLVQVINYHTLQLPEQTKTTDQNIARYCRIGQELVHVVVLNSTDLFQVLKATQVGLMNCDICLCF